MGISVAPGVGLGFPFTPVVLPGAGRFHDWIFPDPGLYVASLTVPQPQTGRNFGHIGAGAPAFARTLYTADPGTPVSNVLNGVNILSVQGGAAAGQGFCAHVGSPILGPNFVSTNECHYYRWQFIMAPGNAPGSATSDYGGYIVQPNSSTPDMRVMAGIAGFGFQFADLHTVQFVAQGPNGRVLTLLPIPGNGSTFDATQLHNYELRLFPGTRTGWATLQALFDGTLISLGALNSSWTPGTNLPGLAINSNHVGFGIGVINNCLAASNLNVAQVRSTAAPTFQDLF